MINDYINFTLEVDEGLDYELAVDDSDDIDMEVGSPIVVRQLEGGSIPLGGNPGDIIIKRSTADFDAEWVAPADSAEQDNTRPITSAAVYTEIGNINALLATI